MKRTMVLLVVVTFLSVLISSKPAFAPGRRGVGHDDPIGGFKIDTDGVVNAANQLLKNTGISFETTTDKSGKTVLIENVEVTENTPILKLNITSLPEEGISFESPDGALYKLEYDLKHGELILATIRKTGGQDDYLPMHNFGIEIDGVVVAGFKHISGIESEVEIIELKDGDKVVLSKRPGHTKYSNIVLKRGFLEDPALMEWYEKARSGTTNERKSISIILLDDLGQELKRRYFFDVWPCGLKMSYLIETTATEKIITTDDYTTKEEEIVLCGDEILPWE